MATFRLSTRRLILAGGFAVAAAAAPAVAFFAMPAADTSVPVAQCPGGEEQDIYNGICIPGLVPNSPFGETSPGGLPEVGGVPCEGRGGAGACIELGQQEEDTAMAEPFTSVESSP